VTAYLFTEKPVTLIDTGSNNPETESALSAAFDEADLSLSDLHRVILTHAHIDHYGCAFWLQEKSGCEVLIHKDDAMYLDPEWDWRTTVRDLFVANGVPRDVLDQYGQRRWDRPPSPKIKELSGGETIPAGDASLRIEHHAGHSPGHIWAIDEEGSAIYAGDYLLANSPTNAGMDPAPEEVLGSRPMLEWYEEGLKAMSKTEAEIVFPAHGPVIRDHPRLIEKRLTKSAERTERVHDVLLEKGESTPAQLTLEIHGEKMMKEPFAFLSDVVGRLQMLFEAGKITARLEEDIWLVSTRS